jgi:hypothetical protein
VTLLVLRQAGESDGRTVREQSPAREGLRAGPSGLPFRSSLHAEALARREAGETLVEIARSYAVSHATISRL